MSNAKGVFLAGATAIAGAAVLFAVVWEADKAKKVKAKSTAASKVAKPVEQVYLVDEMGFLVPKEPGVRQRIKERRAKGKLAEGVWKEICSQGVCAFAQRQPEAFRHAVLSGVPPLDRGLAWRNALRVAELRASRPSDWYQKLCQQPNPNAEQIERDIGRTFPMHVLFRAPPGRQILFRVLSAFSLTTEVGYVQGMNFVAGLFIICMGEEDAFLCLYSYMHRYGALHFYRPGLSVLIKTLQRQDVLIAEQLPELARRMKEFEFPSILFATPYFLTGMAYNLPCRPLVRLWDAMLLLGPKGPTDVLDETTQTGGADDNITTSEGVPRGAGEFMLRFSLSWMTIYAKTLVKADAEELHQLLRKPHITEDNIGEIIAGALPCLE